MGGPMRLERENYFKNRIKEKMSRKKIERLNERIDKLEQKQQVEERKYDDMKDDYLIRKIYLLN